MDGEGMRLVHFSGMENIMKIDVIIPVCNPGADFEALLERLGRQTLPVHKLLVMNTRSKTDVEEMLEGRPGIQTVSLEKEEFDHGGPRDRAFGRGLSAVSDPGRASGG